MSHAIKSKLLGAAVVCAITLTAGSVTAPPARAAGIPVIDGTSLVQHILSVQESITHTMKKIEDYRMQLKHYENMLKNSLAPAVKIWNEVKKTIDLLKDAHKKLKGYIKEYKDIKTYLAHFKDLESYKKTACYDKVKSSDLKKCLDEIKADYERESKAKKDAADALVETAEKQLESLDDDVKKLTELQNSATTAEGQMEALSYANQFAGQQTHQLLQMRQALAVHHNAVGMQMQAQVARESREQAAAETLRQGAAPFRPSSPQTF